YQADLPSGTPRAQGQNRRDAAHASIEITGHCNAAPTAIDLGGAPSPVLEASQGARGHRTEVDQRIVRSRSRRRRITRKAQTKIEPGLMVRLRRLVAQHQIGGGLGSERVDNRLSMR